MIVKALEENGAKVYIVGRRKELLEKVAKEEAVRPTPNKLIAETNTRQHRQNTPSSPCTNTPEPQKHGNIIPLQGDASSKPDLARVVAHITQETGYIDLLVANAGTPGPAPVRIQQHHPATPLADVQAALWATDPDAFDGAFSSNVRAVYFCAAAFLPLLDAGNARGRLAQSSQVVVTSSIGAYGRVPLAHFAYSASKAAVTHMAKQLSTALTGYRIRFNVIAPGCEYSCPLP